jgi:hypothetical protein
MYLRQNGVLPKEFEKDMHIKSDLDIDRYESPDQCLSPQSLGNMCYHNIAKYCPRSPWRGHIIDTAQTRIACNSLS